MGKNAKVAELVIILWHPMVRDFWRSKKQCIFFDIDNLISIFCFVAPADAAYLIVGTPVIGHHVTLFEIGMHLVNLKHIKMAYFFIDIGRDKRRSLLIKIVKGGNVHQLCYLQNSNTKQI